MIGQHMQFFCCFSHHSVSKCCPIVCVHGRGNCSLVHQHSRVLANVLCGLRTVLLRKLGDVSFQCMDFNACMHFVSQILVSAVQETVLQADILIFRYLNRAYVQCIF